MMKQEGEEKGKTDVETGKRGSGIKRRKGEMQQETQAKERRA